MQVRIIIIGNFIYLIFAHKSSGIWPTRANNRYVLLLFLCHTHHSFILLNSHLYSDSASSSSSPIPDDEDDEDDDEFYDPLEISPSTISSSSYSTTSPTSFNDYSHPPPSLSSSRPAPPLTATLPTPSHSLSPNHVIFATYNAGRPRATSPPSTSTALSPSLSSSSSFTPTQSYAPSVRGWESATGGDAEKKELEEYRQKFALLVAQVIHPSLYPHSSLYANLLLDTRKRERGGCTPSTNDPTNGSPLSSYTLVPHSNHSLLFPLALSCEVYLEIF